MDSTCVDCRFDENEDEGFMIGLEKRIYLSRGYIVKLIPHLPTFYVLEIL